MTGGTIVIQVFKFHSAKYERSLEVRVPVDEETSQAQIEDLVAKAAENWLLDLAEQAQRKVGQHKPSPTERREVGAAIREWRSYQARRAESTNDRIYYPVAKVGAL